jgi:hypothetical protein
MTNYQDDISQAERRAVLKSDRDARTYFERAQIDDGVAGRWAKPQATVITSGHQYPAASASHADSSPPEPPLGFAIDEQEPVGTAAEVERSIAEIERRSAGFASLPAAAPEGPRVQLHEDPLFLQQETHRRA